MTIERHRRLIETICKECALGDPHAMHEIADVAVNDTVFRLIHGGDADPEVTVAFAGFGELPARNRATVLARLLMANLHFSAGPNSPSFAYDPENRRVILVFSFPLGQINVEHVLDVLKTFAAIATQWRQDYFLGGVQATSTSRSSVSERLRARFNPAI